MKKFGLFCLLMFFSSCGGSNIENNVNQAELVVSYDGTVMYRRGGLYIDENGLRKILAANDETHYVIFADDISDECRILVAAMESRDILSKVHFINIMDEWAADIAGMIGVEDVPTLVVELADDKGALKLEGAPEIMMYLVRKL
jgi:hypothetical protein